MKTISKLNSRLILFLFFVISMIVARMFYTHSLRYIFLPWNIFLAFIPYLLSGYAIQYKNKAGWKQVLIFLSWLLFLPNAIYIVTDLIHLNKETSAPVWYDALLLYSASVLGLMMAFISLQRMENVIEFHYGKKRMALITSLIFFLSGFGVYLGRVERWNSWNVINDPLGLSVNIINCIRFPIDNIKAWGISFLFAVFCSLIYAISKEISVAKTT